MCVSEFKKCVFWKGTFAFCKNSTKDTFQTHSKDTFQYHKRHIPKDTFHSQKTHFKRHISYKIFFMEKENIEICLSYIRMRLLETHMCFLLKAHLLFWKANPPFVFSSGIPDQDFFLYLIPWNVSFGNTHVFFCRNAYLLFKKQIRLLHSLWEFPIEKLKCVFYMLKCVFLETHICFYIKSTYAFWKHTFYRSKRHISLYQKTHFNDAKHTFAFLKDTFHFQKTHFENTQ